MGEERYLGSVVEAELDLATWCRRSSARLPYGSMLGRHSKRTLGECPALGGESGIKAQ
ncbi:hypothetical protein Pth03_63180 [Planotetraspora thailandica]|uniref:Uncharacterized protein n=1 Tax=Planotetraspora thailandica TaxID=487172 RepID=A0A8J3VBD1_9ACTN|nr:hypothetical protein Pth03_63180 [Planotetraspora thailandica]